MFTYRGLVLDNFQEEAIKILRQKESLLVVAPTGSGKTLIAEYAISQALENDKHLIYTAPIKALSNQKFRDFSERYPQKIGILTGDVSINPEAPILIMTTEILRNTILERDKRLSQVEYIIFDEAHFMDDVERGTVWEECFIFAPSHIRFLCLSATISNVDDLANWLSEIRGERFHTIKHFERPVPLYYRFLAGDKEFDDLNKFLKFAKNWKFKRIISGSNNRADSIYVVVDKLLERGELPCIYFVFSREETENLAHKISSYSFLNAKEEGNVLNLFYELVQRFRLPEDYLGDLAHLISRGIAYHHAGLLPTVKEVVETIFTTGLIKVLFATETFSLGVNMPAKAVVFHSLVKFDGSRLENLKSREFQQMAGRAGRRGIDKSGVVYVLFNRTKPQIEQVQRIIKGMPEPIVSKFNLSYSTILSLYKELGNNIFEAVKMSFANYEIAKNVKGVKKQRKDILRIEAQLKNKLLLLKHMGYIDKEEQLTEKGYFASRLFGYELALTELFFRGLLFELSVPELCVFFCALVYEGKRIVLKGNNYIRHNERRIRGVINNIITLEKSFRVLPTTRFLNFYLSDEIYHWVNGIDFSDLLNHSKIDAGDLVRNFRQVIQIMRDVSSVASTYKYQLEEAVLLVSRIEEGILLINRDEIDEEKRLCSG